jgi:glycosyltransferase involved in cell wall biosynthesis
MPPTHSPQLNILMVAPQPFFRARGTPFSVLHRIRALTAMGHRIDLITYPFGEDIQIEGLRILRCSRVPFIKDIKIGPSFSKLFLDVPLAWATWRACATRQYHLLHSHEEAAFFCAPLARRYGLPHVYDMHSSLPQQLENFKSFNLGVFRRAFASMENHVLETSDGVITICQDLAEIVMRICPQTPHETIENTADDAVIFAAVSTHEPELTQLAGKRIVLYTGTFEPYQGLDLLLEAFVKIRAEIPASHLVLVGGRPGQVELYRDMARNLNIESDTTFVGQVHPSRIPAFIRAAEVIASPRSSGTNTPLKIYGYLRSDRPIVATDLPTHTQTLNREVAELVPPNAGDFARGVIKVLSKPDYARQLAQAARKLSDTRYSHDAYMRSVSDFYKRVIERVGIDTNGAPAARELQPLARR